MLPKFDKEGLKFDRAAAKKSDDSFAFVFSNLCFPHAAVDTILREVMRL